MASLKMYTPGRGGKESQSDEGKGDDDGGEGMPDNEQIS